MRNQWVHRLPGRLRITVPGLKKNPALAAKLDNLLINLPGVTGISSNAVTGRTLIYYNPNLIDENTIIIYIEEIRTGSVVSLQSVKKSQTGVLAAFRQPEDLLLVRQVFQVMFSGLILVALVFKRRIFGRSELSSSPGLFGLASLATVVTGYPILYSGLQHLAKRRRVNYDLVISTVTLSLLILRESFTGLLITWIINLSELLQTINLIKARQAINKVSGYSPREAWVKVNGTEICIPIERLRHGDIIIVDSGQNIPVDGEIVFGRAAVDESRITGVPHPVHKETGSEVLAGSTVIHGRLEIQAERIGSETFLSRMIEGLNSRIQNDDECKYFDCKQSDNLVLLSLLFAGGIYLLTRNVGRSLAMLLAACPSAASLASPTAVGAAIGFAANHGIYIRDGKYLLAAGEVDTVIFDKTGTLTVPDAQIEDIVIINREYSKEDIIRLASVAEGVSGHPVADAVRNQAVKMHTGPSVAPDEAEVFPGLGVVAKVGGKQVLVGNETLMIRNKIATGKVKSKILRCKHLGLNPVFVAVDGKLSGMLGIRETLKPESHEVIGQLRAAGIKKMLLLTGDTGNAAAMTAARLGLEEGFGDLEPLDKAQYVRDLKQQGYKVAMVGDGINDVAAMNEADTSIALAYSGVESAASTAGIVIPSQDLRKVVQTVRLGQETREIVKQNYTFALGLNIIGLGLGAAGLITPLSAGLFTNISTMVVIINSMGLVSKGIKRTGSGELRRRNRFNKETLIVENVSAPVNTTWHVMKPEDVLTNLDSDCRVGLIPSVRELRLQQYGANKLNVDKRISWFSLLIDPFKDFMVQLLLGASAVSLFVGEYGDALTILVIVGIEAVLGVVQGLKAEKSLSALKTLAAPSAKVLIEGQVIEIKAEQVVPGDIIYLEEGDNVPADCRIIEASNLEVEEASLTGESLPVIKDPVSCSNLEIPLAEHANMVFMGTCVTKGRGKAIVTATGLATEMGRIATMLHEAEQEETPLQQQLEVLGKKLAVGCILTCGGVVAAGLLRGRPLMEMLKTGVSLAVGAIPEGLPAVVTISLAFGVQRMVKGNAIVRNLPSVETLGSASVICTDKTGTLTKNEMMVTEIYGDGDTWKVTGEGYRSDGEFIIDGEPISPMDDKRLCRILTAAALCNNANIEYNEGEVQVLGDPTELALLAAAIKGGLPWPGLKDNYCREKEVAFDAVRKMMSVMCKDPDGNSSMYTKGAPDYVLKNCSRVFKNNKIVKLDVKTRNEILKANERMASKALRVLAVAFKPLDADNASDDKIEQDLIFIGLLGMEDPPRQGVFEAVQKCRQAGIKVVMVTGDHHATAAAIAKQLNILDNGLSLTGNQINNMSDEELVSVIDRVEVCSRTTPEHKLRIVKAFKRRGHIVAMTGDGVNDAPAVKEADVGIAMGRKGTDVTREAAAITLADDNFATIVTAVEEGRTVGDNIRKSIRYVLAGNFGEVLAIFIAAVSGMPMPLIPSQILCVNLVTESIPAMALGADSPDREVMNRQPENPRNDILAGGLGNTIAVHGILTGLTTFGVFAGALAMGESLVKARTMAFTNLVISQLFNLFDSRKLNIGRTTDESNTKNKLLVPSAAVSAATVGAAIYVPGLRSLFQTVPLGFRDWGIILISSGLVGRIDNLFRKDEIVITDSIENPSVKLLPETVGQETSVVI